nr:hypothetical protein pmam_420 [Pithovirus mammoth]
MAIPTLHSLILNELSFDSLLEFEKDSNFSPYLGWEFWASKLEKERQIPKDFFYLVREQWALEAGLTERKISPSERYLELASEFEFFPQSESLRGAEVNLERSLNRGDEREISYWVSKLSAEEFKVVNSKLFSSFSKITPENFVGYRILHRLLFGKERNFVVNRHGEILTWQDGDEKLSQFFSTRLSGYLLYQQAPEYILNKIKPEDNISSLSDNRLNSHITEDVFYNFHCRRDALRLLLNHGNLQALRKVIEMYHKPGSCFIDLITIFCWCLESGKIEMVDMILPICTSSLEREGAGKIWSGKVHELISPIGFSHNNKCEDFSKGGKYDLTRSCKPGWEFECENICEYLVYAVRSGNPQMVDFICSLQGIDLATDLVDMPSEYDYPGYKTQNNMIFLLEELFGAMKEKPTKFFGFYQILQRILTPRYSGTTEIYIKNCSVDIMNLILSNRNLDNECRTSFLDEFINRSLGEFNKRKFLSDISAKSVAAPKLQFVPLNFEGW